MKNKNIISILMPLRNEEKYLKEAIESIQSQTYPYWELICIDDGSTDNSWSILNKYRKNDRRIKIIRNKSRKGIGYSLNKGLIKARGEFIARMDADDISLPSRFEKQINFLLKNPKIIACGGQASIIDHKGKTIAQKIFPCDSKKLSRMIMMMIPLQHPILMAKANILKKYKYSERVGTAEDVDMLFYLLSKGRLSNLDSIIYKYRKSDESNGYHNVKKTFNITFKSRFGAILKYGYKPSFSGVIGSLIQFIAVNTLPSRFIVKVFEAYRFNPPLWKRILNKVTPINARIAISGKNPI